MTLPLEGIKIIDFTVMQAGPVCTQLLAWFGADVLKIERPGKGDVTRKQFRDIPDVDGLYFTMVNCNKRSLEINAKTPEGKAILEKLIRRADVLVENLAPKSLERMGFSWEYIHELNPRLILGSVKGFGEKSRYSDLKAYENVAQCAGGAASVTGFSGDPPTVVGSSIGDSNAGMHLALGILAALRMREKTGLGQKVSVSMQDAVINLCRSKLRDQLRLERLGRLDTIPGEDEKAGRYRVAPRMGNATGEVDPGWMLKCKGWERDPNAYIYLIIQDQNWSDIATMLNKPEWTRDPQYRSAKARQSKAMEIFRMIEDVLLADKTKDEAVEFFRKRGIPCAPVKSMREIARDPELRASGTIVEVEHNVRGKYLTVGCPVKFSGFQPKIKQSPLLGEHTKQVLRRLGYTSDEIVELHKKKIVASTAWIKHSEAVKGERSKAVRESLERFLKKHIYSKEGKLST